MATSTPWGPSQTQRQLAKGIILYSTAGHGGVHLSKTRNAEVAECWRRESGWYEEDCDAAIAAYTFPLAFSEVFEGEAVVRVLRNFFPHEYMAVSGETITVEESHTLRDEAFWEANVDNWVAVAAFGDWHKDVPTDMVGVCAVKGGGVRTTAANPEERYFMVPKDEYNAGGRFVVNLDRHHEVAKFYI